MPTSGAAAVTVATPAARERAGLISAFVLCWTGYASYYLGRKGFSVTKSRIEGELHLQSSDLAAIDTAYLIAYAVGQFVWGPVGDRIGARRLMAMGLFCSAACTLAFGQGSTSLVLLMAFAANGLFQASGWPASSKAMAGWTEGRGDRGTIMGMWGTCYQIGGLLATWLASALLIYGWRATFRIPAIGLALVGAIVLMLLREKQVVKEGKSDSSTSEAASEIDRSIQRAEQRAVYANPIIWCYGAAYFSLKLIRYSLLFWLPYYLHKVLHFEEARAGFLSTAFEVGGAMGTVSLGLLCDRHPRLTRPMWSALSMVGLGLALLAYARVSPTSQIVNVLMLASIGFLLFGPDSVLSGAAAQDAGGPRAAGTAAGIVNGVGSIGAILQGWVMVSASRWLGWEGLFIVFVPLAFAGALVLLPAIVRRPTLRPAVTT